MHMRHPCTAIAAPELAGARSLTLTLHRGSLDDIEVGTPIQVAGSTVAYSVTGTTAPDQVELDRPLVEDLPAPAAVYFAADPDAVGEARVAALAAELKGLREAMARCEAHADQTESDRSNAERAHAGQVADAMVSGAPVPAKPPKLSSLQQADQSADAALGIIRRRITELEGKTRMAAIEEGLRRMAAQYDYAGDEAHDALREVMTAMARLHDATGLVAFQGMVDHVHHAFEAFRSRTSRHDTAMNRIKSFMLRDRAGVTAGAHMVEGSHGDQMAASRWPTRETIARAAEKAAKS